MTEFASPALEDLENTRDVAALLEAAKTGNLDEVIGQLDGVGTPVDSCVLRFGRTSLHWACEGGHENVCAKLISAQADVNFRDRSGATPLHWAAWNGHAAVCTLLIQHGADPTAQDNDSDTPLDGASDNACKERSRQQRATWAIKMRCDSARLRPTRSMAACLCRLVHPPSSGKRLVDE